MPMMKAAVFVEPGRIVLESKPIPEVGLLDALPRVTTTTICGTDVLGSAVTGYEEAQRVIAGAITPSGRSIGPHG
jgi:threonine dehydrogenase-like Zn-dependent dehydrogenase